MRLAICDLKADWVSTVQAALQSQQVKVSRAQVRDWLKSGKARWQGRVLRLGQPLQPGWLDLQVVLAPSFGAPSVVWQSEGLLAVHKPAGLLTHATADGQRDDLVSQLRERYPQLTLLHRLDRETSGLVLLALDAEVGRVLSQDLAEGRLEKTYWAWVQGRPPESGRIDRDLEEVGGRVRPGLGTGKPARTRFRRLAQQGPRAWLELNPETGRKHQLRVHLASSGWPIVGDPLYGGPPAPRLALHALALRFVHPRLQQPVEVRCEPDWEPGPFLPNGT